MGVATRDTAPIICAIGATDPWNVVGLGLDTRILPLLGARPIAVVAGVTAQGPTGLLAAHAVDPSLIAAQFASFASQPIAAYRIGALLDAASVEAVADALRDRPEPKVLDIVLGPTRGGAFADAATLAAVRQHLLPQVTIVTPNLAELAALLGNAIATTPAAMVAEAKLLRAFGARAVLVTGGHLDGHPVDVLVDALGTVAFGAPRLAGSLRGTGCLLADALAAGLARGTPLRTAVSDARAFVRGRIHARVRVGGMDVVL